eukprot:TRINITY_DN1862_c0_g1_i1.p1 TRINITY_DN1862_c0_g1~~TRINITY_DN1862_c0_g1_i1.p1  ORF type:complete len:288 (+),score=79.02 TRINITY_DN1862_c0_g1_i1:59-922(+)
MNLIGEFRFTTFNVRYANPNDGEDLWFYRKNELAEHLAEISPTVIGLQEVLIEQIGDIMGILEDHNYSWVGVGRTDGVISGEFNPILYKTNELTLKNWGTKWLSDNPNETGTTFGALPRIVTYAEFEKNVDENNINQNNNNQSNNDSTFFVYNTHFSHVSSLARVKSANLILDIVKTTAGLYPSVLMGDFNCDQSSKPYAILQNSFFTDAATIAENKINEGACTFCGFCGLPESKKLVTKKGEFIDFLFVSGFTVKLQLVSITTLQTGRTLSDHRPVIIDCDFLYNN